MPVDVGQSAPGFTLPSANKEGSVSLSDYRGKAPVLLALFRGLYCPFCRHQIARLAVTADKLRLGDIITFDHFDQTTTHRIVGVEGSANGTMFSTKGDANQVTDPEPLTFPGRVGLVKLAVPGLGYAVAWMQYIWRLGATVEGSVLITGVVESIAVFVAALGEQR